MGGAGLGRGLELLGVLDHFHDPVIPAAAHGLLHLDNALPLLCHGTGIDKAAGALGNRLRFPRHRGLVHHGLSGQDLSIQRNQAAGADHDLIPHPDLPYRHQHLRLTGFQPDVFHLEGHGSGQIRHGLLVGPLLQDLTQTEHEHDGSGGIKVPPDHGNRYGSGIQHRYRQLAVKQCLQAFLDVF